MLTNLMIKYRIGIEIKQQFTTYKIDVKGGFELSFYGGLKMYDSGGLRIDRC